MKLNAVIVVCVFAFFKSGQSKGKHKRIDVLFESLCPDSLSFIRDQLYPNWKELAPYVDLKLVPFGKSESRPDGSFECQHGPLECKGNRIMSCALKRIEDQNVQVEFVHCFMKLFYADRDNEEQFGQKCAQDVGLDMNDIFKCYGTTEGKELQLEAEKITKKFSPSFWPTIIFDGVFNQQYQDKSFGHFREQVCELLEGKTQGDDCQGIVI